MYFYLVQCGNPTWGVGSVVRGVCGARRAVPRTWPDMEWSSQAGRDQ